jgi:hypothetical protein
MSKKLATPFNLLNHKINTEYLNYDKIPDKHRAGDREELRKIVKTICKHIAEEVVEREGGVHISRLGYFFVWKIPRKMTYNTKVRGGTLEEKFNYHTNHYMFSPIFLPSIDSRNTLKYWGMDNSFSVNIRQGIKEKVSSGFKYKIYPYSLYKINMK